MEESYSQPKAYLNDNNFKLNTAENTVNEAYLDNNLYAPLPNGQNQSSQQFTGNQEVDDWLSSLPEEQRQKELDAIYAPLTGEEVARKRIKNRDYVPTIDEFKSLMDFKKTQEIEFLSGLGEAAMHIAGQFGTAGEFIATHPLESTYKAPANLIEATFQGFRNFYGMLAESENPDSSLFKFRNFITGDGTIESQYEQYLKAIKFNNDTEDLMNGKITLVMDKDYINNEVVQATSNMADPTLFVGLVTGGAGFTGKIAQALGQAERLAAWGARASAIKNGLYAGTLKWGAGVPLEIVGGATRNTINYGLEKGAKGFEFATGISAREAQNYVKRVGFGTAVTDLGGYGVPIASEISQAYVGAGIAKGFGEAINATIATAEKQGFKRGGLSFAKQALEESNAMLAKGGMGLSVHAQNLLKVLDKADPFLIYAKTGLEGATAGMVVGGGLGYLNDKEQGLYSGMGAGMALGAIGALGGRSISDLSGATKNMRYDVQAKMALEVMKERSPSSHLTWNFLRSVFSKDINEVNKLLVAVDTALPNTEWAIMNPLELRETLKTRGLDPDKFDGFEHETTLDFEPKPKQEGFTPDTVESRARNVAVEIGFIPDSIKAQILAGDYSRFKLLLEKAGTKNLKNLSDAQVKELADKVIANEDAYRAEVRAKPEELDASEAKEIATLEKMMAEGKKDIFGKDITRDTIDATKKKYLDATKKGKQSSVYGEDGYKNKHHIDSLIDLHLEGVRQAEPADRAKEIQLIKEGNTLTPEQHAELVRRAQAEGLINSKGIGESEKNGSIKYKLDKDGNKIRAIDEMGYEIPTIEDLSRASGWIEKKGIDGKSRIVINTDFLNKNTVPHEFGHGLFSELVLQPEFKDRLRSHVLGIVDKDGKMTTNPSIDLETARTFFKRYIDLKHTKKVAVERKQLLDKALQEYFVDGKMNVMDIDSKTPYLESLVEDFGAYYWSHFIKEKPVDFLFNAGETSMMSNVLEMVKNGYIDLMKSEIERVNPKYRFNENATSLNNAFLDKKGNFIRIPELDVLMTDVVRAVMQTNRKGSFDFSSLSIAGQQAYIKANGLERIVKKQPNGKYKMMSDKEIDTANKARGIEIYKALDALDPKLKVVRDDKGNVIGGLTKINNEYVGMLSNEVLDHLVATGHVSQAEASKIKLFQDISLGKTKSNIVEMTYHGLSAQTTTGAIDIRVYGDKVPIKNRKVLILGIDNSFKQNGVFSSKLSTLDWRVIETRGKNLWEDPVVRQLWGDDRGAFEGDFFRYLENASKPKTDTTRVNNFEDLWQESGAMKRNIMNQFAGLGKQSDVPYANIPLTEIHWDINQSFMYLRADRTSNVRLSNEKVTYNHNNAGHDISRNMMPAEMMSEDTPNGRVYRHPSGYRFIESDKNVKVFDANGDDVGSFTNLDEALQKAKEDYTAKFPNEKPISSFDNVKAEVVKPQFEGKADYINKNVIKQLKSMGGNFHGRAIKRLKEKIEQSKLDLKLSENKQSTGLVNMRDLIEQYTKDVELYQKLLDGFESGDLRKLTQTEILVGLDRLDPYVYPKVNKTILDMFMEAGTVFAKEWDAKYPMTFRSPLDDAVKSFFASGKDITAQQLLKRLLRVGSSKGIQIWNEANKIGLIKLLKGKIKPTERIYRTVNPETGQLYPRGTPDAPVIKLYSGEQQVPLDKNEILKYLDDNKIILTIEENAKEVNGLQTERFTADGERQGYRETALRINPQYRHNVRGHYDRAVAHLRTTDRIDAEGNNVNYMEEAQANNTDERNAARIPEKRNKQAEQALKIITDSEIENLEILHNDLSIEEQKIKIKTLDRSDLYSLFKKMLEGFGVEKAAEKAGFTMQTTRGKFTNERVKNLVKTHNNLIDAWADSITTVINEINPDVWNNFVQSKLEGFIKVHGDAEEFYKGSPLYKKWEIYKNKLTKENILKYVNFVRNQKYNINLPIESLILHLSSFDISQINHSINELKRIQIGLGSKNSSFVDYDFIKNYINKHKNTGEALPHKYELLFKLYEYSYKRKKALRNFINSVGLNELVDVKNEFNTTHLLTGLLEHAYINRDFYRESNSWSENLVKLGMPQDIVSDYLGVPKPFFSNYSTQESLNHAYFNVSEDGLFYLINQNIKSYKTYLSQNNFINAFKHLDVENYLDSGNKIYNKQGELYDKLSKITRGEMDINPLHFRNRGEVNLYNLRVVQVDARTITEKYKQQSLDTKDLPFMSVNDWGLHMIKLQIREAIQKGQRKLTITHPDDAPTKSNMDESRYALYGEILPNLARGFLKKWGIEVKQDLKLHNELISNKLKLYADKATETSHKMKSALDVFEEVKAGENSEVISRISPELAMPVQDLIKRGEVKDFYDESNMWIISTSNDIKNNIKSNELKEKLLSVVASKGEEWRLYKDYLDASSLSKSALLSSSKDASSNEKAQTQYAIDRGHSFILNDEIIKSFIRNDEDTALKQYMPKDELDKTVPRVVNQFELDRMMAIIKRTPHLKAAFDNEQLTFDEFQHSKYKKYHVVSHGLDNASTVDWKDPDTGEVIFKAQGGGTYPVYRSPQGWATNLPSMADQINRVGALNFAEHGEWIAPIMFIKSKDSKVGGSVNGSIGFVNAFYALNKRGAINDKVFKSGLLSAFKTYFKEKGFNLNKDSSIGDIVDGARKILSDKKYPPFIEKANIINALNSSVYESVDYTNPFVEKFIPSVADFKSNKRILVDDLKNAIFKMMSDPLFEHAKHIKGRGHGGEVYGMVMFNSEVEAKEGDYHDSYTHSIVKKDGTSAKVDILTTPIHPRDLIKNYVKEVETNEDKSLKLDANKKPIYKEGIIGDEKWADREAATGQKNLASVHNKLYMPADFKDSAMRLMNAIDAQSYKDGVQNKVRAGLGSLIKAINKQTEEDVRSGILRGVRQLADAIDKQSDEDKIPEKIKVGIKGLIKASEEIGKPVKENQVKYKTKQEEQPNVVDEVKQTPNQTAPETKPVYNNNFPEPQFTSKWRSFTQETTTEGNSIFKNAMNYIIIQAGKKYRVYNPYKTMIGVYDDLEQAKRRVQREEPKQLWTLLTQI